MDNRCPLSCSMLPIFFLYFAFDALLSPFLMAPVYVMEICIFGACAAFANSARKLAHRAHSPVMVDIVEPHLRTLVVPGYQHSPAFPSPATAGSAEKSLNQLVLVIRRSTESLHQKCGIGAPSALTHTSDMAVAGPSAPRDRRTEGTRSCLHPRRGRASGGTEES
jgi:hypothetical protein